ATQSAAPNARISETAATRVAALHHALKDRDAALRTYLDIAESEGLTSKTRANALLQGSGVYFEILQRRALRQGVTDEQWDELRQMLEVTQTAEGVSHQEVKIARLMRLESWTWQGQHELAVDELPAFIADYDETTDRREIATARIFGTISLNHLGRHVEALEQTEWVIGAYEPEEWVWPTWQGLPRAYFERFHAIYKLGAAAPELQRLAREIQRHYPNAGTTKTVTGLLERHGPRYRGHE
ncbi:MAG: hypothetical protein KF858_00005, partial [Candidatus Sumerlaeia bacterium]|nr:hypothetical protein [Candidatus Sumerlaeia bacterium]